MRRVIRVLSAASPLLETAANRENTTGPPSSGAPEFVRVTVPSSTAIGLSGWRAASALLVNAGSAIVRADEGGTVTAGRYIITIPAGALKADTRITLRVMEEDGVVGCELLPHGIEFLTAVQLTMDLTGTSFTAVEPVSIYGYDTRAGEWVDVGATLDSTTLQLWTRPSRFSCYRAGRIPGW
jgi:hypothetical protein